ncbi:MAG: GNAT family N-acetyltransferase [Armatimonadota bacterium]
MIRPAAPEDVSVILRFIRELAEYERLADACVATEELLRDALFPDLGAPVARVLLAEEDGVPVGFALWFPSFSTFLARAGVWLEDLFVVPSARGRGIGQALLDSLAEIAAQSGGRLEWSVLKWNTPSIEFYERLGAERMEEWVTYRLETYSDS